MLLNKVGQRFIKNVMSWLQGAKAQGGNIFNVGTTLDPTFDVGLMRDDVKVVSIQQTAVGPTSLVSPAQGKKLRVLRIHLNVPPGATLAVAGQDLISLGFSGSATYLYQVQTYINNAVRTTGVSEVYVADFGPYGAVGPAGNSVNITLVTALNAGSIGGCIVYIEEDA